MRALLALLFVFGVFATPDALAQRCPSGSHTGTVPAGATVTILGIHQDDAYYSTRGSIEGVQGTAEELHSNDGCWYGGSFTGFNGQSYYFYKAAISLSGGGGSSCPSGAMTSGNPPAGSRVRILAINTEDAYYSTRGSIEGISGTATELHNNGGCWYGGSFMGDNGQSYYFYKAAISAAGGSASCPSDAMRGSIGAGTRVRVTGLNPEDAYYDTSYSSTIGLTGTTGAMNNNGDCWFGGPFTADNGEEMYFYKAAFASLGSAPRPTTPPRPSTPSRETCPADAISTSVLADAQLKVEAISSSDPYSRGTIVRAGDIVVSRSQFERLDDCWYAGDATLRDGTAVSFTRAAFSYATEKDLSQ